MVKKKTHKNKPQKINKPTNQPTNQHPKKQKKDNSTTPLT